MRARRNSQILEPVAVGRNHSSRCEGSCRGQFCTQRPMALTLCEKRCLRSCPRYRRLHGTASQIRQAGMTAGVSSLKSPWSGRCVFECRSWGWACAPPRFQHHIIATDRTLIDRNNPWLYSIAGTSIGGQPPLHEQEPQTKDCVLVGVKLSLE